MRPSTILPQILFLVAFVVSLNSNAQINQELINELDSMVELDQRWRTAYREGVNLSVDSLTKAQLVIAMEAIDNLHYTKLKGYFDKYGFLDYDLVGEEGSHDFWLLMQHQDSHPEFQEEVLAKMAIAVDEKKASYTDYAYLLDRVLVNTGKLQMFGTQMTLNADSSSYIPKPVDDADKLDKRRKKAGLPPMMLYIKIMNERYMGNLNQ